MPSVKNDMKYTKRLKYKLLFIILEAALELVLEACFEPIPKMIIFAIIKIFIDYYFPGEK